MVIHPGASRKQPNVKINPDGFLQVCICDWFTIIRSSSFVIICLQFPHNSIRSSPVFCFFFVRVSLVSRDPEDASKNCRIAAVIFYTSILIPITPITMAKIFLSMFSGNLCASHAPSGAVKILATSIPIAAGQYT